MKTIAQRHLASGFCVAALAVVGSVGLAHSASRGVRAESQDAVDPARPTEEVLVDRDDFVLERSARVRFTDGVIADANGDGVLIVRGEDLVIDLTGAILRGAAEGVAPDAYTGLGIRVEGARVTLSGGRVSGFKVGLDARGVDGLVIEDADVSDNFRQRLRSTPEREHPGDWLQPHDNDAGEWLSKYGAGIHVKGATDVTIRRCRARDVQNGLILDRVENSYVYDNDFSFLSGWGVAMWRSSKNLLCRNSLDFCVRGYSHGIYNRGQDSAGLLMFEQCSENTVVNNSMTHGGDGIFGFAGKEALGDNPAPEGFEHARKGNNKNMFLRNDLAYAAAHGYEMTFSFRNTVFGCRFVENAICGIWAGYSQDSVYSRNIFRANGEGAYGLERGGINIEHGKGNLIQFSRFIDNACGIRLWWDEDPHLADKPWVLANGFECGKTALFANTHVRDSVGVEIDGCPDVLVNGNRYQDCGTDVQASEDEQPTDEPAALRAPGPPQTEDRGERQPVGLRLDLQGRHNIIMTEWGPYAFEAPLLVRGQDAAGAHVWRVLGTGGAPASFELEQSGDVEATASLVEGALGPEIHVRPAGSGLVAYSLSVTSGEAKFSAAARSISTRWQARAFASPADPREDLEAWRAGAESGVAFEVDALELPLGGGALAALPALAEVPGLADLPADGFGLVAETTLSLPAGSYALRTRSDDGIRVSVDGEILLEDWTHHASLQLDTTLVLAEGEHVLRVEWFELSGGAELIVELEESDG